MGHMDGHHYAWQPRPHTDLPRDRVHLALNRDACGGGGSAGAGLLVVRSFGFTLLPFLFAFAIGGPWPRLCFE